MPTPAPETKRWLAKRLWESFAWRAHKARQYPDDPRNSRSANALSGAAIWVDSIDLRRRSVPTGFRSVEEHVDYVGERLRWGEESARVASLFFFDDRNRLPTTEDYNKLLHALARAIEVDSREAQQAVGEVDIVALDAAVTEPASRPRLALAELDESTALSTNGVPLIKRLDSIEEKLDRVLDLLS